MCRRSTKGGEDAEGPPAPGQAPQQNGLLITDYVSIQTSSPGYITHLYEPSRSQRKWARDGF